jgi:hypothetical protein
MAVPTPMHVSVDGNSITVGTPPGKITAAPEVWVGLCDQNDPNLPQALPDPLPDPPPSYLKYQQDHVPVDNLNFKWSYTFTNVATGTYVAVVIPRKPQKQVQEVNNVQNVMVP